MDIVYMINRICYTAVGSFTTILSCFTFVIYSILGNSMNPHVIFPAYLYLDAIASQLTSLRNVIGAALDTYEGYALFTDMMNSEERKEIEVSNKSSEYAFILNNVTWKWFDPVYVKKLHDHNLKKLRYIKKVHEEFTKI